MHFRTAGLVEDGEFRMPAGCPGARRMDTPAKTAYTWAVDRATDMTVLKSRYCLLLAAVACITGCGKQERIEAVQFAKVLTTQKANFVSANKTEKDFVTSAPAWCGGITA